MAWLSGSNYRALQGFADRFEPADGGYLFRSTGTAAPVKVSDQEYAQAIADFTRGLKWLTRGGVIAFLVAFCAIVGLQIWLGDDPGNTEIIVFVGMFMAVFVFIWWRLWTAPNRAFARKAVAGVARTRTEARRLAIQRIPWSQFGASTLFVLWGIWRLSDGLQDGRWNILWVAFALVVLALVAWRAWGKWRLERRDRPRIG